MMGNFKLFNKFYQFGIRVAAKQRTGIFSSLADLKQISFTPYRIFLQTSAYSTTSFCYQFQHECHKTHRLFGLFGVQRFYNSGASTSVAAMQILDKCDQSLKEIYGMESRGDQQQSSKAEFGNRPNDNAVEPWEYFDRTRQFCDNIWEAAKVAVEQYATEKCGIKDVQIRDTADLEPLIKMIAPDDMELNQAWQGVEAAKSHIQYFDDDFEDFADEGYYNDGDFDEELEIEEYEKAQRAAMAKEWDGENMGIEKNKMKKEGISSDWSDKEEHTSGSEREEQVWDQEEEEEAWKEEEDEERSWRAKGDQEYEDFPPEDVEEDFDAEDFDLPEPDVSSSELEQYTEQAKKFVRKLAELPAPGPEQKKMITQFFEKVSI